MGKKRAAVVVEATVQREDAQDTANTAEPTFKDKLQFYSAQYIGLVVTVFAIGMLWVGYGKEWMHDTHLCLLCLGLCLLGLFFHETRPFNVSSALATDPSAITVDLQVIAFPLTCLGSSKNRA
jgi:hypothetical protein